MRLIQFLKDWTLPVAISLGISIYIVFRYVSWCDQAGDFFLEFFRIVLPILIFAVLFVTFCRIDFRKMRLVKWHAVVLTAQMLLLLIVVALIVAFQVQGSQLALAQALLCCVIAPCASASPVVTSKLGGSLEEATSYTYISNLVMAILIPLVFPIINPIAQISFIHTFSQILYKVCSVLLLPILAACVIKYFLPTIHRAILSVKDLSFYLWALSLAIVSGITVRNIFHAETGPFYLILIAVASLAFCAMQFVLGRLLGNRLRRPIECGQAFGQKNTAFAIWVASAYLIPLSTLGPGCYILWQNLVNSWELMRDKNARDRKP